MRRSLAPSHGEKCAKRGRFCPPFSGAKLVKTLHQPIQEGQTLTTRSTLDLLKLIENSNVVAESITDSATTRNSVNNETDDSLSLAIFNHHEETNENVKPTVINTSGLDSNNNRYFTTVWCKLCPRKHKKWEGDAILIVKNNSVILKNLDGKEIGKAIGYKKAQLDSLEYGSRLTIGGKEVEIVSTVSEEMYASGQCFTSNNLDQTTENLSNKRSFPLEPFRVPNKLTGSPNRFKTERLGILPRHDPLRPGALVLPRPSTSHQWKFNHNCLPIVDVVVDPVICNRLRPHQRDGVIFLYECVMQMHDHDGQGAILADDMGLGKTLQCITLIWTLLKQGPYNGRPVIRRALIVTPSSLTQNWYLEFNQWLGRERIRVSVADQSNKIMDYAKSPIEPILITSYELLTRHHELLFIGASFDLIVCDEGHRLKNSSTKTSTMLTSLPIGRRILLTGTPIQNDLQEFYALVEFCNPGILGSMLTFRRVYEEPILRSKQKNADELEIVEGTTRATELSRVTSLFTLRRTQDINNKYLPPKVEYVVFCKPSSLQLILYKSILNIDRSVGKDRSFHLVCIDVLKKICNHPSLILEATKEVSGLVSEVLYNSSFEDITDNPNDFCHSGKLRVLDSLLESLSTHDEKVVLVSASTQMLNILESFCKLRGYTFGRLDGSTPTVVRQSLVDRFNDPQSNQFIFLLSTRAGGVGLNLIGASRIVLYDIDWNPANDLQAMSRVWRDGQRHTVHIYRLLTTGTIEEKIYQRQMMKQNLSGTIVDNKDTKMSFSSEELKDIFSLDETSNCNTHDLLGCDCLKKEVDGRLESGRICYERYNRPCQLDFKPSMNKSKNLSTDELMSWKHFDGPPSINEDQQNCFLSKSDDVTFTFLNVVRE